MALGRDVDAVRIARMDTDLADVSGIGEAHVHPALTAVARLVDPVAVGDVGANRALAHARVDDPGLGIRHRERAYRGSPEIAVAHVSPGGTRILGLPDAARHRAEEEHGRLARMTRHRHHPAAAGRADAAKGHGVEQLIDHGNLSLPPFPHFSRATRSATKLGNPPARCASGAVLRRPGQGACNAGDNRVQHEPGHEKAEALQREAAELVEELGDHERAGERGGA